MNWDVSIVARKTKEEALETRENILKATLDVFSEKGYSKSTFVDIAERVGLTKGAVYWHFKCKGELLVELIQRMHEKEERLLKEKLKNEGIHFHNLKEYYLARARLVLENEEFRKFAFFISLQMEWTVEHLTYAQPKIQRTKDSVFSGNVSRPKRSPRRTFIKKRRRRSTSRRLFGRLIQRIDQNRTERIFLNQFDRKPRILFRCDRRQNQSVVIYYL